MRVACLGLDGGGIASRLGWKGLLVLCLTGFVACGDNGRPGTSHQPDVGAGGQSDGRGCPTALVELQELSGKPCDEEGASCPASGAGEHAFKYECSEGTWTLLDSNVHSSGGAGGHATAGQGGIVGDSGTTGEGGIAGEGGVAGESGFAGEGAIAGEGGIAGESGSAGESGIAGESGGAGESGIGSSPVDPASMVLLELDQRPYTECDAFEIGADYARDAQ